MHTLKRVLNWLAAPAHSAAAALALVPAGLLAAFMWHYHAPYPTADFISLNLPLALAVHEGTFTLADLFTPYLGHRHTWTLLTTAVLTRLTGWNLAYEYGIVYVLAVVNVGLAVALARRDRAWVLVPVAWLMLPVQLGDTWLIPHNMWFHSAFFALLTTVILTYRVGGRWALVWALLAAVGALLALSNGLALLPAGLVVIALTGRYSRREAALYVGGAALIAAVYLLTAPFSLTETGTAEGARLPDAFGLVRYVLAYLGAPLAVRHLGAALWIGVAGAALLAVNGVALWRAEGRHTLAGPAGMAAFAVGSGVLIAAGRAQVGDASALYERYSVLSSLLWVALVITVVRVLRGNTALAPLNALAAAGMAAGYILTGYNGTPVTYEANFAQGFALADIRPFYQCVGETPITRSTRCPEIPLDQLDRLAGYGLAGYARRPAANILPGYTAGDAVVIAAGSAWEGVHARDWLLDGVPLSNITHVIPAGDVATAEAYFPLLDRPPAAVHTDGAAALRTLEGREVIWTVTRGTTLPADSLRADYALTADAPAPYSFTVRRYLRVGDDAQALADFGAATLLDWTLADPVDVTACDSVGVRSVWRAAAPMQNDYKLTLVLAGPDQTGATRTDSAPSVRTSTWDPAWRYADERLLSVPCETAPGAYPLLLGVYREANGAVQPIGDLYYLTTLNVR